MPEKLPEMTVILSRLEKLEKESRRLKRGGATCLLVAACVALMAQARTNRTVEAEKFVLHDAAGNVKGVWSVGAWEGQPFPALVLNDAAGKPQVLLMGGAGSVSPSLGVTYNGESSSLSESGLHVFGKNAHATVFASEGIANVEASGRDGFKTTMGSTQLQVINSGEMRETSAASIVLFGKEGKVLWSVP